MQEQTLEKNKIGTKQHLPYEEAIHYLEDLLKGFKAKKIVVSQGEDSLTLVPAEHVTIEIEAKAKKGKAKFELELGWSEAVDEPLSISDKEPTPKSGPAAAKAASTAPAPQPAADAPAAKPKGKTPAKDAPATGPKDK